MKLLRTNSREALVVVLLIATLAVWTRVWASEERDTARVYFFDVGQGDSIFIESPTLGRVLIDGGPTRKVLSELGQVLPLGDRRIDLVIESHPDADHITGLLGVFDQYEVSTFIHSGVESDNSLDNALAKAVLDEGARVLKAKRGMSIDLGGGLVLEILFPNIDVSSWETNDASVVSRLDFGETSFLLTGDSTKKAEYIMLGLGKDLLDTDVMQVGHHGSETSTSFLFLEAVSPEYSVISVGERNRYGHPSVVTLDTLSKFGTKVLETAKEGTILFETDGETLWIR
jgi:competence protein ComEC